MIPFEELDRALARWKAKVQSGLAEPMRAAHPATASDDTSAVPDEELAAPPEPPAAKVKSPAEADLAELETVDD